MIKTQKMTPEVYYNTSRDFQLFGRLYDVIFNYLKNNSNAINDITTNLNPNQKILELMCNTLGFKTTHVYDNNQLSALCSIFLSCMKGKGTAKSVLLLLRMVCCIENSTEEPQIIYGYNTDSLTITLPADVSNLTLVRDVLNYIMPAGTSYELITQSMKGFDAKTEFFVDSAVSSDTTWSPVSSAIIKAVGGDPKTDIISRNLLYDPDKDPKDYEFETITESGETTIVNKTNPTMYSSILSVTDDAATNDEIDNISINVARATKDEENN